MKRKTSKNNFDKFTKRNTHKRKGKEQAKKKLLKLVAETGVGYDGARIRFTEDRGGAYHSSSRTIHECESTFMGSSQGFGFASCEGLQRDIFIPEDRTLGAIDGDRVLVEYKTFKSRTGEEKTEGRIKKILSYGRETVVGRLERRRYSVRSRRRTDAVYTVIPDDPKICVWPTVTDTSGAAEGEKVVVRLVRSAGAPLTGVVTACLGAADSFRANYAAVLAECGIPVDFSPEEIAEAERAAAKPISDIGRTDFRGRVVFTMDSASAKDLDDAVSVEKLRDGWLLGVHIADVSYYVAEKTALDRATMRRGTSVYFTDKVVPMLPESLSNGACSLNAGEDKYALSALIRIDFCGNILEVEIKKSIIRSRVKGVYSEINALLDGNADAGIEEKYKDVRESLSLMHRLYIVLAAHSKVKGAVDMDIPEAEIVLDADGYPIDVVKAERGISERMIEQFMLAANEAVASCLYERGIPCIYRVHAQPPEEKIESFADFLKSVGIDSRGIASSGATSEKLSEILCEAREKGIEQTVAYSMLRSMAKAEYSDKREGHFGLGIENYCHFTSPIRRLSDLATHRIIHRVLFDGKDARQYASYASRASVAATDTEIRAVEAERRIENLYKVIYMSDRLGEEFDAVISSITSFGIFVRLENTCEGLVPMSDLGLSFVYDERTLSVRRGLTSYRLGDKIRVVLEEADPVRGKLRFSLIE